MNLAVKATARMFKEERGENVYIHSSIRLKFMFLSHKEMI